MTARQPHSDFAWPAMPDVKAFVFRQHYASDNLNRRFPAYEADAEARSKFPVSESQLKCKACIFTLNLQRGRQVAYEWRKLPGLMCHALALERKCS